VGANRTTNINPLVNPSPPLINCHQAMPGKPKQPYFLGRAVSGPNSLPLKVKVQREDPLPFLLNQVGDDVPLA
jgi:hypothetical protein